MIEWNVTVTLIVGLRDEGTRKHLTSRLDEKFIIWNCGSEQLVAFGRLSKKLKVLRPEAFFLLPEKPFKGRLVDMVGSMIGTLTDSRLLLGGLNWPQPSFKKNERWLQHRNNLTGVVKDFLPLSPTHCFYICVSPDRWRC